MSPNGTRLMGDLEKLPGCAPAGLHGLHAVAEGVIQRQITLLGSGTPSKAPDLRELLRKEGITKPEDQSTMLDKYSEYKDEVDKVKTGIQGKDDGIVVRTAGIGGVVKKAYDDIDTSVGEVNELIIASHKAVQPVTDDKGNPKLDENGNRTYFLPKHIVDGLFKGIWNTLNTTLEEVQGVSDKAATEALKIIADEPDVPTTHGGGGGGGGGGGQPALFSGSGGGDGPVSSGPGPSNAPIRSTEEELKLRMEMMEYLVFEKKFTPAQAAGIIGNAYHESKFNLGAEGDGGTAHGLFQWRFGRWEGLKDYASRPGEDINDWKTHLDYMAHELRNNGSYQNAENIIDANPDNEKKVAEAFDWYYEISSRETTEDRKKYATDVLEQWNDKHGSSAAV